MTNAQLIELMNKNNLSREDLASLSGKSVRQVYSWTSGLFSVPRSVAILVLALDEGLISPGWVVSAIQKINRP